MMMTITRNVSHYYFILDKDVDLIIIFRNNLQFSSEYANEPYTSSILTYATDAQYVLFTSRRLCAMFLPELASFAAAMLFAVHPIHTEAVSTRFTFQKHHALA